MITALFEDGVFTDFLTAGHSGTLHLPDGTTFPSAGLVSLKFWPEDGAGFFEDGSPFFIAVGAGHSGDVDAFCKALDGW